MMKLLFKTSQPLKLRKDIVDLVRSNQLETWSILVHSNEEYLKHTGQWGKKGVIQLSVENATASLVAEVLKFKETDEDVADFEGYYLGRFCELMFVNFADRFNSIVKE